MATLHRHNPTLASRLKAYVDAADGAALAFYLRSLTHSERRTAGYMLSENLLPGMQRPQHFFSLFCRVVPTDSKAYLGTFLKAATALYREGKISPADARLYAYAAVATPIDARKILETFLPIVERVEEVEGLVDAFCRREVDAAAGYLIYGGSVACYYVLFRILCHYEDDVERLKRCYIGLLRKNQPTAFHMACVLRDYFALQDLPGRLSLQLPPYQFSRLMTFEGFAKIVGGSAGGR